MTPQGVSPGVLSGAGEVTLNARAWRQDGTLGERIQTGVCPALRQAVRPNGTTSSFTATLALMRHSGGQIRLAQLLRGSLRSRAGHRFETSVKASGLGWAVRAPVEPAPAPRSALLWVGDPKSLTSGLAARSAAACWAAWMRCRASRTCWRLFVLKE